MLRTPEVRGRVLSINISDRKGISKRPVEEGEFVPGAGIVGDAHFGTPGREVSLLDRREIDRFVQERGVELKPGAFAENLTIEGLDLLSLPVGTELLVGEEVLLVISQHGKECHSGCAIREQVGDCIMPRRGVFARVVKGGRARRGDPIQVLA
ncbi:TPA: MOSC domain-containing protein [Candidatus Bipolaricaulota bacterium]|nr:MOSC domain-containing protein [Candidatus Bipolaricaulota bacterium]